MTSKQTLKECPAFSGLTGEELEKLARLSAEKQYEAGAVIFQGKHTAEELLVIEEGKVALQMELPAAPPLMQRKVTIDVVTRNDILGWSVIVDPYTYTMTAVCLQKTKALAINGSKLRELLQDDHQIGYKVLSGLINVVASRLFETVQVLISERTTISNI